MPSKPPSLPLEARAHQLWHPGPHLDASETKMSELGRSMIKAGPSSAQSVVADGGMRHGDELRTARWRKAKKGVSLFL